MSAVRYKTCQHFYYYHVWSCEFFAPYAKFCCILCKTESYIKINFILRWKFLSVYIEMKLCLLDQIKLLLKSNHFVIHPNTILLFRSEPASNLRRSPVRV